MPSRPDLPSELAALARCQAVVIADHSFDEDAARLVNFLAGTQAATVHPPPPKRANRTLVLSLGAAAVVLTGLWWLWPAPAAHDREPPGASAAVAVEPDLNGEWVAELQKPGQRPFTIRMTLARNGAQVIGSISYPTGDASIADGHYVDGQLTFQTSHVPQFESEPATIRVQGRVENDEIRMTTADAGGVATGVARRAPTPRRQ
jgi:hypothetical protein